MNGEDKPCRRGPSRSPVLHRGLLGMLLGAVGLLGLASALAAEAGRGVSLRAGARVFELPIGSAKALAIHTQWLGLPLHVQGFHAPLAVDELAHRIAGALPRPPALLVEPGRATLAWYEAPVHWRIELTGRRDGAQGILSGLTLLGRPGMQTAREPGVPASAALLHSADIDGDARSRRRVQVYARHGGLARAEIVAGLRRAGWTPQGVDAGRETLHKLGMVMYLHCLPAAGGACVLTREAAR